MEDIICKGCGVINSFSTIQKGGQLLAYCAECGSYIKHLPQGEPKLYIGKYKGKLISEITDLQYLEWCIKTVRLSPHSKNVINEQIQKLKT